MRKRSDKRGDSGENKGDGEMETLGEWHVHWEELWSLSNAQQKNRCHFVGRFLKLHYLRPFTEFITDKNMYTQNQSLCIIASVIRFSGCTEKWFSSH